MTSTSDGRSTKKEILSLRRSDSEDAKKKLFGIELSCLFIFPIEMCSTAEQSSYYILSC